MGGAFAGQPAASARNADRIDVFAAGTDGRVRHKWWDGKRWVPWEIVPGAPEGATAVACSWVGGRLDLFVRDPRGELHHVALSP